MECKVVTVSRALGASGEEVARLVAEKLGFQYVSDEIITWAAEQAGVSPETVGRVEQTPPLIARILAGLANAPAEPIGFGGELMPLPDYSSEAYKDLITQVVRDTADKGRVVIVAHGASIPLAGMDDILRVFITAPENVRAARTAAAAGISDRDAQKAVENSDKQRHEFFRRFYGLREELPTHYDLVVNTERLRVDEAADVILKAAGR